MTKSLLSDKAYEILKWLTVLGIPALCTLYSAIASAWGLPYAKEISETGHAIAMFFGALIGVSTVQYNKANSQ